MSLPSTSLKHSSPLTVLLPAVRTAGTVLSAAIDLQTYDGEVIFNLHTAKASAGTTPTLTVTITECATSGGTYTLVTDAGGGVTGSFAVVTDAADAIEDKVVQVRAVQRYIKVSHVVAGANASYCGGVSLRKVPKYAA